MNPLGPLFRALEARSIRCVLIGVAGANHYALGGSDSFVVGKTQELSIVTKFIR